MAARLFRIVCIAHPRVNLVRSRIAMNLEYLNNPFPNRFALKRLFDWHTLDVLRLHAVQAANHVLHLGYVAHAAASRRSPICRMPEPSASALITVICRSIG